MPRVNLTLTQQREAEAKKLYRKQDGILLYEMNLAKGKATYEEIARKAGVGKSTVQKAFNRPNDMRIDLLRKICLALGVRLEIYAEQ